MKKALMNASVASMIYKFNMSNIDILEELGYKVDVACNFGKENPISEQEISKFRKILEDRDIAIYENQCPRKIYKLKSMCDTYRKLKKIIEKENYDLIYTQSPIGGVLCRLAAIKARKRNSKVIYVAHGFHFYKGGPVLSWILFYPIEKMLSKVTDLLITINKSDYQLAKKHFYAKKTKLIPGVGVDIERFQKCHIDSKSKRAELGVPENAFIMLSVGELSSRKNQQIVIDAMAELKDDNIYYIIAGKGELYDTYLHSANSKGIRKNVRLLGVRTDIDELCACVDVFVHPSAREGLGIAPLEAMASGLPLISTYINGIRDYTEDGVTGICIKNCNNVEEMKNAIKKMREDSQFRKKCADNNVLIAEKYSLKQSRETMKKILTDISDSRVN